MRKHFASGLRLLAQLTSEPVSNDLRTALERSYSLRGELNTQFDEVRSLADGVLFEFGPTRQKDLELRSFVRRRQPELRALFVMRIALWKYRAQVPGFELPESVRLRQQEYDEHSAQMLEEMADRIENNTQHTSNGVDSRELFSRTLDAVEREQPAQLPTGRAQMFVELLRGIDALTTSLASEIARGI